MTIPDALAVLPLAADLWWPVVLAFLRCAAAASVMPGFGERSLSVRVKLAGAFALAWPVSLTLAAPPPLPETPGPALWLILTETAIGLVLGLGLRVLIWAMQTAGAIAAQVTSLAQLSGGAFPDPLPGIGQILSLAALTLLMLSGFPVQAVLYLAGSYSLFPPGTWPDASALATWGLSRIVQGFDLAFRLAAPFFLLSVLYNLTLGAINRAMPQLMVALVGAPLITWGSLALLMLAAPVLLGLWMDAVAGYLSAPFGGP